MSNSFEAESSKEKIYKIKLDFNKDILKRGINPLEIINQVAQIGDLVDTNTNVSRLPNLLDLDPQSFYLSWVMILKTKLSQNDIESKLAGIREDEYSIIELDYNYLVYANEIMMENRLGEVLLEKGLIEEDELQKCLDLQRRLGEILVQEGKILPNKMEHIIEQQKQVRNYKEQGREYIQTRDVEQVSGLVDELTKIEKDTREAIKDKEYIKLEDIDKLLENLNKISKSLKQKLDKIQRS